MASAEDAKGAPPQPTEESGGANCELSQRGPGQNPGLKYVLAYF